MGMYDTICFDTPFVCPVCGRQHSTTQVKWFGQELREIHTGEMVTSAPTSYGILADSVRCAHSQTSLAEGFDIPIHLVIWHGVYAGAFPSIEEAKRRLESVDRADLLVWVGRHQTRARKSELLLDEFLNQLSFLHRFAALSAAEKRRVRKERTGKQTVRKRAGNLWKSLEFLPLWSELMTARDPYGELIRLMEKARAEERPQDKKTTEIAGKALGPN